MTGRTPPKPRPRSKPPPYVGPRGWIGARLDIDVDWSLIAACVEESYQMTAPKRGAAKRARA